MNPWWLLLIVPVTFTAGFILCSFMVMAQEADRVREHYWRDGSE